MSRKIDRGDILNAMKIVDSPKKSLQAVTWNGTQVKAVFREKERTLQADIGNFVFVSMGNILAHGEVSFTKGKLNFNEIFGSNSEIRKNFNLLFKGDITLTQLSPDIANVLNASQKKDIYRALSTVYEKLELIYQYIVTPDGASYDAINRYVGQITEVSKLCRDIHQSALSSESLIERKKHDALRGSEEFDKVEPTLKKDLIMAFKQMGWDITTALEKDTLENITSALPENASVEVGGVSPFTQTDVATFILNYRELTPEQKRTFSIPRLFEVYGDAAKKEIERRFINDETSKRQALDSLESDMDKINSEKPSDGQTNRWTIAQLSGDGSLMRYSREMMGFIHSADIAREERKRLGNANTDSVRLAGVSGLELVREDFQEEAQLESLREEIKKPFLDAIANEISINGFKVKKDSAIVRNYMELLAIEKRGRLLSDRTETFYFKKLCKEVYSYMTIHHMSIDSKIVSEEVFISLQEEGMTLDSLTPATSSPKTSPAPAKEEIDEIKAIIENAENAELLETYLSLDGNADVVTKHLEGLDDTAKANLESKIDKDKLPLYCAAKTLIENARTKCGKKDTPIADLWESAKEEISEACKTETDNVIFNPSAEATNFGNLYKFGMFDTLATTFINELKDNFTFEGSDDEKKDQKKEVLKSLIRQFIDKNPNNLEVEFYQEIANCVMNGTTDGNKFYANLYDEARNDILVSRYNAYIERLQKEINEGVNGKPLSDDEIQQRETEINTFNDAKNRAQLVDLAQKAVDDKHIEDVESKDEIIEAYNNSAGKDAIKKSTLGDKKEFDSAGLAKKLKPFNVKAGQKYLDDLVKAIKKVSILEQNQIASRGSDKPGPDHDTPDTSIPGDETPNTGTPNGVPTNPNYTPEELKEKAAFYIMGKALDQSLSETLNLGGLTDEDRARLLSEQKDMKELFDLLAFGEDKDQKYDFNNGKNTIKCSKIGYIQQIIYSKATDPNFKMDANELALVLAEGNAFGVGTREPSDTDAQYLDKILKHPRISAIIRSLESIKPEIACALIGITSTRDGKNCCFAGKVTDKILEGLKDAKTPEEIRKELEKMATVKLENPAPGKYIRKAGPIAELLEDAKLDMAVANSRESFVKKVIDDIKKEIKINASKDDQKADVFKYFETPKFADQLKTAGIGIARGTVTETMAAQEKRTIKEAIERGIFAEIEKGLTANANPVTPAFAFKLDGDSRQILKENVEMFMANGQLEYTEIGKELIINVINNTRPELAEKLAKISLEDFVKLIKEFEPVSSDEYEME